MRSGRMAAVEKEANRAKEVFVMSDFVSKVNDPPLVSTAMTADNV